MKLGNQIGTVVNTYNTSSKEFAKIDKDVTKISGKGNSMEPMTLESPKRDE